MSNEQTPAAAIELRDLRYRFEDGTEALRGVSLSVAPGECVGLIGPNGAGKSTLLLHLNGLLPETLGGEPNVYVMGKPLTAENLFEIRRHVGLLFQDPNDQLFCPTVFEDVAFGPQQFGLDNGQLEQTVTRALEQVGLSGFEQRSPQHLSGGEKRRVCLAGVLACQPSVLVLDEPTSDLDPRGRRELKQLLASIPVTKIIATHDLEMVVELCSRVFVIDRGVIVAQGRTVSVLSDERLMLAHSLEKPHILQHQHPHPPTIDLSAYLKAPTIPSK
jgi:cobalt/nickel transport system ATP-binding protein